MFICPFMNAGLVNIYSEYFDCEGNMIECERNNCALWIGTYEDGMCSITKIALKE